MKTNILISDDAQRRVNNFASIYTFRNGITKGRSGKLVACWSFAWNSSTDSCEFCRRQTKQAQLAKFVSGSIEIKKSLAHIMSYNACLIMKSLQKV